MESVEDMRRRLKNEARAKREAERERRRAASSRGRGSPSAVGTASSSLAAAAAAAAAAAPSSLLSSTTTASADVQARLEQLARERKEREKKEVGMKLLRANPKFAKFFDDLPPARAAASAASSRPTAAAAAAAARSSSSAAAGRGAGKESSTEMTTNTKSGKSAAAARTARTGGWTSKTSFTRDRSRERRRTDDSTASSGSGGHRNKKKSSYRSQNRYHHHGASSSSAAAAAAKSSSKGVPMEVNLSADCSLDEPSQLEEPSPLENCSPPSPPKKRRVERQALTKDVASSKAPIKPFAPSYSLTTHRPIDRTTTAVAAAPTSTATSAVAATKPAKKTSTLPKSWRQDSDSEDSIDIVEFAKQAEERKRREALERQAMEEEKKADEACSAAKEAGGERKKGPDSSSDEDIIARKKKKKKKDGGESSSSGGKGRRRHRRPFDSDSSSDDDDDLAEHAAKSEREKERKRPHNPITAARMQEERIMAPFTARKQRRVKKSDSGDDRRIEDERVAAQAQKKGASNVGGGGIGGDDDDDFWSDASVQDAGGAGSSDDEKPKKKGSRAGKKRASGARAKSTSSSSSSSSTRKPAKKRGKQEPDKDSMLFDGCDPIVSYDSDDEDEEKELESRLKPEFANPKLGVDESAGPYVLTITKIGKPSSRTAKNGNEPPCELEPDLGITTHTVPPSINRYLQDYQREGIKFMHKTITDGKRGCILGDDMGLGKTVQVIALLAAIQKKAGNGLDRKLMQSRRSRIGQELRTKKEEAEKALLHGAVVPSSSNDKQLEEDARKIGRILIIVPASVIKNWQNEFDTWGHFGVAAYQDKGRDAALERVRVGIDEVLICGKTLFSKKESFKKISAIKWRLVLVDEYHEYKGYRTGGYKCLEELRNMSLCPIIGLTGTVIQNNYEELHALVDMVQPGLLGNRKTFKEETGKPLYNMRQKAAKGATLAYGEKRKDQLHKALKLVYLHRDKDGVLKDDLTEKKQNVIFCKLSDIQKRIYLHLLSLPEFHLLRVGNTPCDCGINQKFFLDFKRLKTKKEQLEFQRRKKNEVVTMKEHCYSAPWNPKRFDPGESKIDPLAVLWKNQHQSGEQCDKCPSCTFLPALSKLYKVSSHPSLLQADQDPNRLAEGTGEWERAKKVVDFAKVALPPDILAQLPGGSYVREDGIMDDHLELSGKMETLDFCLEKYNRLRDRVLIFSYSTKTLDLIQNYVQAKGYSFLRFDGTTATKKRQGLVDQFQKDDSIFLFLISTKAGGMGLNLTAANKVIVFDVNWNPSYDEQAQDRAYRIGQNRNVEVIRLVAEGTIEELMYARQVYKTHLKQQALGGDEKKVDAARLFRGVVGDKDRKGELFGVENLLKFKDGSFMSEIWKSNGSSKKRNVIHDEKSIANALSNVGEAGIENLGGDLENAELQRLQDAAAASNAKSKGYSSDAEESKGYIDIKGINHEDFLRKDRGGAAVDEGDEGFDEEMGGASQMMNEVCEMACEGVQDVEEEANAKQSDSKKFAALSSVAEEEDNDEGKQKGGRQENEESSIEKKQSHRKQTEFDESNVKHEQKDDDEKAAASDQDDNAAAAQANVDTGRAASAMDEDAPAEPSNQRQDSPIVEVANNTLTNILIIADAKKKTKAPSAKLSGILHRPSYKNKKRKKK